MQALVNSDAILYEERLNRFKGQGGGIQFDDLNERDILDQVCEILKILETISQSALEHSKCSLSLYLRSDLAASSTVEVRKTGEKAYKIDASVEFLHLLVRSGLRHMASVPQFSPVQSILIASAMIFLHELAHVAWGHLERPIATDLEYRTDEVSADYRSGVLLARCLADTDAVSDFIQIKNPDDQARYTFLGALVLHTFISERTNISARYHTANNRFVLVLSGYLTSLLKLKQPGTHCVKGIQDSVRVTVINAQDRGFLHVLSPDAADDLEMEKHTEPGFQKRVAFLLNQSEVAEPLSKLIGKFVRKYRTDKVKLIKHLLGKKR